MKSLQSQQIYEAEHVPILSSSYYLTRNALKRNVVTLQSSVLVVLPDQKKQAVLLRLTQSAETKPPEPTFSTWKLHGLHQIARSSNRDEVIRDLLLVPDLSAFGTFTSQRSSNTDTETDQPLSHLSEAALNIFLLTKTTIEQYFVHSERLENCRPLHTISIDPAIISPIDIHIIDSLAYQQRILLLQDNKGGLHRLSLWKKEVVIRRGTNPSQPSQPASEPAESSTNLSITAKDRLSLSDVEGKAEVEVFANHFWERDVATLHSRYSSDPRILTAHEVFSSRFSQSRQKGGAKPGKSSSTSLELNTLSLSASSSSGASLLTTLHFILQCKPSPVTKLSSTNSALPSAGGNDPLLTSVQALRPSSDAKGFAHVLPGMNIHDALHVPTIQETQFLTSLATISKKKEKDNEEKEKDGRLKLLTVPNKESQHIELIKVNRNQNSSQDTNYFNSLLSLHHHARDSSTRTVTEKKRSSSSSDTIAEVEIFLRNNQQDDNNSETDHVGRDSSNAIHSTSSPNSKAVFRKCSLHCSPSLDDETMDCLPLYDLFCVHSLSPVELLIAVASSSSGPVAVNKTKPSPSMGFIYHINLNVKREEGNRMDLFPCASFSLPSDQMTFHGLRFLSSVVDSPSFGNKLKDGKKGPIIPHLTALAMKRSKKKNDKGGDATGSSSTHIISISTEREYDLHLLSFPLSSDLLSPPQPPPAPSQLPAKSENAEVVLQQGGRNTGVQLEDVLSAMREMRQSFEMKLDRIERKLEEQNETIRDLQSCIQILKQQSTPQV